MMHPHEKRILWDHSCLGSPQLFHPALKRNVSIILKDRIVSLAIRTLDGMETNECILLGSVNADKSSEGLVITIDRFEEQQRQPMLMLPGDLQVPVLILKKDVVKKRSVTEYVHNVKLLAKKCSSRVEVDLSNVLKIDVHCNVEGPHCSVRVEALLPSATFKAIPIPSVPVASTALFSSLTCKRQQSLYRSGLLTIDQSRKIVYMLENDPRVSSTQLVGIWVSGIDVVHHPYVWAACLRYLTCPDYVCRICLPPKPFLVALCTTINLEPQYFDCFAPSETSYYLLTGQCSLTVTKVPSFSTRITVMDLILEKDLGKHPSFLEAKAIILKEKKEKIEHMSQTPAVNVQSNVDDFPRVLPVAQQVYNTEFRPLVPDLSLLSESGFGSAKLPPKQHCDDHHLLARHLPLQALNINSQQIAGKGKSIPFQYSSTKTSIRRSQCNDENELPLQGKAPRPLAVPEVVSNVHFMPTLRGHVQPVRSKRDLIFRRHSVHFPSAVHTNGDLSEDYFCPPLRGEEQSVHSAVPSTGISAPHYAPTACNGDKPSINPKSTNGEQTDCHAIEKSSVECGINPPCLSNYEKSNDYRRKFSPTMNFSNAEALAGLTNDKNTSHLNNTPIISNGRSFSEINHHRNESLEMQKMIEEQDNKLRKLQEQIQRLLDAQILNQPEKDEQPASKGNQSEFEDKSVKTVFTATIHAVC